MANLNKALLRIGRPEEIAYGVLFLATGVIEITQRFCIYIAAEG